MYLQYDLKYVDYKCLYWVLFFKCCLILIYFILIILDLPTLNVFFFQPFCCCGIMKVLPSSSSFI